MGMHQKAIGKSQEHLTPKRIIDALGPFDLDPCAIRDPRPWECANFAYTKDHDGLASDWWGLVWCNPPFHRFEIGKWVRKMIDHNNGILLAHARTETDWFAPLWHHANGFLFLADRLKFWRPDGTEQSANSGAPIVLVSFGTEAKKRLLNSGIGGFFVTGCVYQPEREENVEIEP